jgi:Lon protease-like protein
MPGDLIALFPLRLVLMPRVVLPLHIFEDRYKEMIAHVLAGDREFGVVQATERGVLNTGCTAHVEDVTRRYPDGRLDLVTTGRRRFLLNELNDELSYLRADVTFFDDDDYSPADPEVSQRLIELYGAARSEEGGEDLPELDPESPQLSFLLAQAVPDLAFRQVLLASVSESDRIRKLAEVMPEALAQRAFGARMKRVAPTNGHGRRDVDLD